MVKRCEIKLFRANSDRLSKYIPIEIHKLKKLDQGVMRADTDIPVQGDSPQHIDASQASPHEEGKHLSEGDSNTTEDTPVDGMSILDINPRGICRSYDFFFVLFIIVLIGLVWVYFYHQPIPPVILRLLGMDDPVYN
jgi:hypothetical protein